MSLAAIKKSCCHYCSMKSTLIVFVDVNLQEALDICIATIAVTLATVKSNPTGTTQPAFTCLKLTIETLEQGVKYVQS